MRNLSKKWLLIFGVIAVLCVPVYLITHILWVGIVGYSAMLLESIGVLWKVVKGQHEKDKR